VNNAGRRRGDGGPERRKFRRILPKSVPVAPASIVGAAGLIV